MLTFSNIIVLYRIDNADSITFAQAYQTLHSLDNSQIIGVPCSGNEILASYAQFQTEIENTVTSNVTGNIRAILIGYGVPGGFIDGSDVVSSGSRLSRIRAGGFTKQIPNPLFNRSQYHEFDTTDADQALVVSRIDAPTLDIALKLLSNTSKVIQHGTVNGKFYFDKYAVIQSSEDTDYQTDLTDFENRFLSVLNIPVVDTVFWNSSTDVVVPKLSNDSFMWAWKSNRAGYTFFKDTTTIRVFLYNADTDGGASIRNSEDNRFPMLALSSGYVTTAGAMSDPTAQGLLRPRPFFEALYRGATIGEAYLFATPYLDWTVTLFGDPLVKVKFPAAQLSDDRLSINTGWDIMMDQFASAVAYGYAANDQLQSILPVLAEY